VFMAKAIIKETARQFDLRATFMTKPSNDPFVVPSGFHLHQTLMDPSGANEFLDADAGISKLGQQYIGGQIEHARALTMFAAQTINSYKRFTPGTWAPLEASWSMDDRGRLVRGIPAGRNTRIENRLGASDANPYLLVASQLAAGLLGIQGGILPPAPLARNAAFEASSGLLPTNLIDAIHAMEADTVLRTALGDEFVGMYIAMLKNVHRRYTLAVSEWEIDEYREVL
jgi:glutamine synthetase